MYDSVGHMFEQSKILTVVKLNVTIFFREVFIKTKLESTLFFLQLITDHIIQEEASRDY